MYTMLRCVKAGRYMKKTLSSTYLQNQGFAYMSTSADIPDTDVKISKEETSKVGGFAKAFQKQLDQIKESIEPVENETFATLLRNSKLMDLGEPSGKVVIGQIYHIVENDLYIDFGWKFHCVCPKPSKNNSEYVRGARVRLAINELELSTRFLGSDTDLTLLESDCRLLGVVSSPARTTLS